jgi:hypothetical protein
MFLSLTVGPTGTATLPLLPCCCSSSAEPDFQQKNKPKMENGSNGNEKMQIIYRWKALTEENPLKQFILKMEHYITLASEEK